MNAPIDPADRDAIAAQMDGLEGCGCSAHWRAELAAHPIDWTDPAAWAVDRHNAVNERLGKAVYTPN